MARIAYNTVAIDELGKIDEKTIANLTVNQLKRDGINVEDVTISSEIINNLNFNPSQKTVQLGNEDEFVILEVGNGVSLNSKYYVEIQNNYYELFIGLGNVSIGDEIVDITSINTNVTNDIEVVSQDENIVTIIKTGNSISINPISGGTTKLIATCGSVTAECSITVEQPTLQGIQLDVSTTVGELTTADIVDISFNTFPEGVDGDFVWVIEDTQTACIYEQNENTLSLRGLKAGTTKLKVADSNGNPLKLKDKNGNVIEGDYELKVYNYTNSINIRPDKFVYSRSDDVDIFGWILGNEGWNLLDENRRRPANSDAIINRVKAQLEYKFTSSDTNIATINNKRIFGLMPGKVTIKEEIINKRTGEVITSLGNKVESSQEITVGKLYDSISINEWRNSENQPVDVLYEGEEYYFDMYFEFPQTVRKDLLDIRIECDNGVEILENPVYNGYCYTGKLKIKESQNQQLGYCLNARIYRKDHYEIGEISEPFDFINYYYYGSSQWMSFSPKHKPISMLVDKIEISYNDSTDEYITLTPNDEPIINIKYYREIDGQMVEISDDDNSIFSNLQLSSNTGRINSSTEAYINLEVGSSSKKEFCVFLNRNNVYGEQEYIESNTIKFSMECDHSQGFVGGSCPICGEPCPHDNTYYDDTSGMTYCNDCGQQVW